MLFHYKFILKIKYYNNLLKNTNFFKKNFICSQNHILLIFELIDN